MQSLDQWCSVRLWLVFENIVIKIWLKRAVSNSINVIQFGVDKVLRTLSYHLTVQKKTKTKSPDQWCSIRCGLRVEDIVISLNRGITGSMMLDSVSTTGWEHCYLFAESLDQWCSIRCRLGVEDIVMSLKKRAITGSIMLNDAQFGVHSVLRTL